MSPVTSNYHRLVDKGELAMDAAQRAVALRLGELEKSLRSHRPGKRGLARLMSRKPDQTAPKGLYIHGGVGRGKSMLMDLFFEHTRVAASRRVHFDEFMQEVHGAIHDWRQRRKRGETSGDDPIAPLADQIFKFAHLLCFDEFQVNDIADAMILGRLFEALFERGVVVVATSNIVPDELYKDGLNRGLFLPFIDLLKQKMEMLELDGDTDYRLARLNGIPVYHSPLGAEARRQLQAAWESMTDCTAGDPLELEIKGRMLSVPQAAKGVARFEFSDLCEQPLGAGDYLKLASTFHTIFIDGIPALSRDQRNAAKRLTILIDALYEKKVKLIASAETMPDGIYRAYGARPEFERTVSRLIEMQSAEYLALGHGG